MKELLSGNLGADGGKYALQIEGGSLVAQVGYPVEKILQPLKEKLVDRLKNLIPGDWDDAIIDKAWQEAVDFLSEKKD